MMKVLKGFMLLAAYGTLSVVLSGCIISDALDKLFGEDKKEEVDPIPLATYFDGPKVRPGVALGISVTAVGSANSSQKQYFVDAVRSSAMA